MNQRPQHQSPPKPVPVDAPLNPRQEPPPAPGRGIGVVITPLDDGRWRVTLARHMPAVSSEVVHSVDCYGRGMTVAEVVTACDKLMMLLTDGARL